jgi:hypothetical protein
MYPSSDDSRTADESLYQKVGNDVLTSVALGKIAVRRQASYIAHPHGGADGLCDVPDDHNVPATRKFHNRTHIDDLAEELERSAWAKRPTRARLAI